MATTEVQPTPEEKQAQPRPEPPSVPQLPHHKVKMKKPLQRSCNEKDEKGKICGGHLKRWFYASDSIERACGDVEHAYGKNTELYRCEHCKTIYLPNPQDQGGPSVAGRGQVSVFGLTVPPKETK